VAVKKSQIDQIKIKDKTYDINVPKSWAENDPTRVQYIKDRTHYKQLLAGSEIGEIASHSFKNIYTKEGRRIHTDNWRPQQSWIYAGWPCTHTDLNKHLADETCSGGWYNIKLQTSKLEDQTAITVNLFEGKIKLEPKITGGRDNTIQNLIKLADLLDEPTDTEWAEWVEETGWAGCEVFYHTDGYFYITGEPTVQQADGTHCSNICTLNISPVSEEETTIEGTTCYRRYLYTHQLDASFIPIDGKTVFLDNNGKLRAEDIYWDNFQVTEQFGRYEPREWVPAAGRSVRDVLNDAFCVDKLPSTLAPSAELFAKASSSCYEVGTTLDLSWAIRLRKGSYTYGLVSAEGYPVSDDDGSKAFSNYEATDFTITKSINPSTAKITFNEQLDKDNSLTDNCREPNDSGPNGSREDYKTLKSGTAEIMLPATPITAFTMTLSLNGAVNTGYKASTMKGNTSEVCFTEEECKNLMSTTSNILTSDYKWFWTYSSNVASTNLTSTEIRAFEGQLGGFPKTIATNEMQSMCFFMPKVRAKFSDTEKTLENLDTSVEVLNDATGTSACLKMFCKEVVVQDAGKNDHDYLMYYFTNDAPDSGTNIYKIIVNNLEEGGNS
jgi:hypothetical protein